jgi:ATP-dependent DNA helicase DinG
VRRSFLKTTALIPNCAVGPIGSQLLSEAVIKFKQGFGRLIRTKTDHGTVVCLDPRIVTKPYGRLFLESLPECGRLRRVTN